MRPRPSRRLSGAALAASLLAISLYAMAVDLLHMPGGGRPGQVWAGVDFHTYLAAAVVGLRDGWASVYDQDMVRAAQAALTPYQYTQPFLSPPPAAFLVAPFAPLPYWVALSMWSTLLVVTFAMALGWSTSYRGGARIAAVGVAMAPWWVLLAVYVGQIVPLVAAAVLVSWGLLRRDREIAAGLVLSLIALKPNTAILVPFALLAAGRWRLFASWAGASIVITLAAVLIVAGDGTGDYLEALGQLPRGATAMTLSGAFGLTGGVAAAVRLAIVIAALLAARMLRATPGVVVSVGALASLLVAPYLHNSDLCVLVAAAYILWHETPLFRPALVAMWLAAAPFLVVRDLGPTLGGWVSIELALFVGLVVLALARGRPGAEKAGSSLTAPGDLRRQAPA